MSILSRREMLATSVRTLTGLGASFAVGPELLSAAERRAPRAARNRFRFAALGLNHNHIYGEVATTLGGGGELVAFYAEELDLIAAFSRRYSDVRLARGREEILEDPSIHLVVAAPIPDQRARLGGRGDAPWEGLHERQARDHHARAACRRPSSTARDIHGLSQFNIAFAA